MPMTAEDQLAIQQLYARYNHALDFGDTEGWADCFTPEGVFESATGKFEGREQLVSFAQGFASRMKARHWTNNLVIEEEGNGAAGKCYLLLLRLDGEGGPGIMITGVYHDSIVRADGGWRFASRKVVGDA